MQTTEWITLTIRWLHLVFGAAWIGTSFYFVWLNNHIRKTQDTPEGVEGELWAIHGGGFYKVSKFSVAPSKLPDTLHWFKWEAYLTWLTGIGLLVFVYYLQADVYMVDASVAQITGAQTVGLGILSLVVGWFVYDGLCRSPLRESPVVLSTIVFAGLVGLAYGLSQYLGGRAAYIHVGAVVGTIMAANVFRVIIPNQRITVDAMVKGDAPDPSFNKAAAIRSLHNNYFTLPVLFIMVSNHFPFTYGHAWSWGILAGIAVCGVVARHYFNLRGRGQHAPWLLPAAALGMVALAWVSTPKDSGVSVVGPIAYADVHNIVQKHCVGCHAQAPSNPAFATPPQNIVYDSPQTIAKLAPRIGQVVVQTKTMPPGNLTGMTETERAVIGAWIDEGAKLNELPPKYTSTCTALDGTVLPAGECDEPAAHPESGEAQAATDTQESEEGGEAPALENATGGSATKESPSEVVANPDGDDAKKQPASADGASAQAKTLYAQRCSLCHGSTGKGDGAAAAALSPKPRSFVSSSWQKSVTDDHIAKVIVGGGPAGGKSPMMPANPDLKDKPEVVNALVEHIRALGSK